MVLIGSEKNSKEKQKVPEKIQSDDIHLEIKPADQSITDKKSLVKDGDNKDVATDDKQKNVQEKDKKQGESKKSRKRKKINDPITILEDVISESRFKSTNLSKTVEETLYNTPRFQDVINDKLSGIKYEPTVGPLIDGVSDINISVLPEGVKGSVNVAPTAFLNLPCIYELPKKRNRKKGKTNNQKKKYQQQQNKSESNLKPQRDPEHPAWTQQDTAQL